MSVAADINLMRQAGHDVDVLSPSSDMLDSAPAKARAAIQSIHSRRALKSFFEMVEQNRPDVVNLHNAFPLISPSIIHAAASRGIPVVHTVHNYRLSCVRGTHFREGGTCELCTGKTLKLSAVRHGCYRNSVVQSLPMTASRWLHDKTWLDGVAAFVALNPFMAHRLQLEGVDPSRIAIRPSWVQDPSTPSSGLTKDMSLLFVGRLDDYKGVELLLDAWARLAPPPEWRLRIAGTGPLQGRVEEAAATDDTLEYLGGLDARTVDHHMRSSRALVVPSLCFEGFPLVVVEAMARALPVLTVVGGATGSVLDPTFGWVVNRTPEALAAGLSDAMRRPAQMCSAARDAYLANHTPMAAATLAERIFSQAIRGAQM